MAQNNILNSDLVKIQRLLQVEEIVWLLTIAGI